jgi:hypothetical protein
MFTAKNIAASMLILLAALWPAQSQVTKEGYVLGSNQPGWGGRNFQGVFLPTQLDTYAGQNFGLTRPWDTSAVGPVLKVRRRLSDLQQDSVNRASKDPSQPVLVKFEVVEAWVDTLHASSNIEVPVRAILYWASSRPGKYERFGEVHLVQSKSGKNMRYSHSGASLDKVVVETRDFFATSNGKDGVYGTNGWTISREKSISKETRAVGDYNDAVAVYDISQKSFESGRSR